MFCAKLLCMTQTTASIQTRRIERGWTLQELVEHCANRGASTDTGNLSRIERGIQTPTPRLRKALAELLDLDVADFERKAS